MIRVKSLNKKGFTMVELVVVIVILAILAAIVVPITLNILDSSDEAEIAMDAKSIWMAAQTKFTEKLARDEYWVSTQDNDDKKRQGFIFDQNQKLIDGSEKKFLISDFEGCFLDISNLLETSDIINKIENSAKMNNIYVAAARINTYYRTENNDLPYKVYAVIFTYPDDDKVYFYDGKELKSEWIFDSPTNKSVLKNDERYFLLKNSDVELQMYCIKKGSTSKPGTNFKTMFK